MKDVETMRLLIVTGCIVTCRKMNMRGKAQMASSQIFAHFCRWTMCCIFNRCFCSTYGGTYVTAYEGLLCFTSDSRYISWLLDHNGLIISVICMLCCSAFAWVWLCVNLMVKIRCIFSDWSLIAKLCKTSVSNWNESTPTYYSLYSSSLYVASLALYPSEHFLWNLIT